jgi:uncharacterized protein YggE
MPSRSRLRRTALALAAVALPAALPTTAAAQLPTGAEPIASVTTTGRAEARVTPDRANVLLTVETRAPTAAAAAADNARRQQAVLDALRRLGIPQALLGTAGYNVSPEQEFTPNQPPRVTGYVARSTVRAEVRRIDQVGRVIDTALGAGSNAVGGVQFYASTIEAVRRAALDSAVINGCESATAAARAGGRMRGELLQASVEPNFDGNRPMEFAQSAMMRGAAADTPTPINPGEYTVPVTVLTRWRLLAPGSPESPRCGAR